MELKGRNTLAVLYQLMIQILGAEIVAYGGGYGTAGEKSRSLQPLIYNCRKHLQHPQQNGILSTGYIPPPWWQFPLNIRGMQIWHLMPQLMAHHALAPALQILGHLLALDRIWPLKIKQVGRDVHSCTQLQSKHTKIPLSLAGSEDIIQASSPLISST